MDDNEKTRKQLQIDMGLRLQAARKAVGLTQEQAAEKGGTIQQSISDVENGKMFHPPDVMYRLCQAYHITTDFLISGIKPENSRAVPDSRVEHLTDKQYSHFVGMNDHFFGALGISAEPGTSGDSK